MKGGRHHGYHPLDSSFFCPASFSLMTKKFATKETAFERHSHVVSSHVFFKQSIPLVNSSRHIQSAFDTFLKTRYKGHKSRKTDTRRKHRRYIISPPISFSLCSLLCSLLRNPCDDDPFDGVNKKTFLLLPDEQYWCESMCQNTITRMS